MICSLHMFFLNKLISCSSDNTRFDSYYQTFTIKMKNTVRRRCFSMYLSHSKL